MKPNFKNINIKASEKAAMTAGEWEKANHIAKNWTTPELIPVKPAYTAEDLKGMEHLDYVAGIPPYLRGPYSAMYPLRPSRPSASMPDSPPRRSPTLSIAVTWLPDRKVSPWRSTWQRTADTTPTIRV